LEEVQEDIECGSTERCRSRMCHVYTANEGSARAALALTLKERLPSLHFTSTSSLER
jgi:hypothetical protein